MREIVFDTETTGFEPGDGHRIVEIGCVELMDHFPTGRTLQFYLNPERDVPIESQRVHGLSDEFLADKPLFAAVVEEFLEFIGDAPLVIHNASFDIKFINAELERVGRPPIPLCPRHRHDRDRQAQDSRRALFAGRIVQALRHRPDGAHQAWRAARRRADGADLSGTGRRPAARAGAGAGRRSRPEPATSPRRAAPGPSRWRRASPPKKPQAHAAFVAKELGEDAVWKLEAA